MPVLSMAEGSKVKNRHVQSEDGRYCCKTLGPPGPPLFQREARRDFGLLRSGQLSSDLPLGKGRGQRYCCATVLWKTGFVPLFWLCCITPTWAQDGAPVPPLEAGWVLTLHPVFVHFATALTVFGAVLDGLGSVRRQPGWQDAGRPCFYAGVVGMGLSVLSGWIEQQLPQPNSAFDTQIQDLLIYHEYLGYGLLGFFIILTVIRVQIDGRLPVFFLIMIGLGLGGLVVQGYWGGELVYRYGTSVRAVHILSEQHTVLKMKTAPKASSGAVSEAVDAKE